MYAGLAYVRTVIRFSGQSGLVRLLLGLAFIATVVEIAPVCCLRDRRVATTECESAPDESDSAASERQPDRRHEELPVCSPCSSRCSQVAIRQTNSMPRGAELRHSEFSLSLVPRSSSPTSESLLRLRHLGCRQTASPQPTLEVLFCTWQT